MRTKFGKGAAVPVGHTETKQRKRGQFHPNRETEQPPQKKGKKRREKEKESF